MFRRLCCILLPLISTCSFAISVPNGNNYTLSYEELNDGLPPGTCTYGLDDQSPAGSLHPFWSPGSCLDGVVLNTTADQVTVTRYYMDATTAVVPPEFWSWLTIDVGDTSTPVELCEDPEANNVGEPLPCTYDPIGVCEDPAANNLGQPLPCTYDPVAPPAPTDEIHMWAAIHSLFNWDDSATDPTRDFKFHQIPFYLGGMMSTANRTFSACGQYGFLPTPPAICQIGWETVESAWDDDFGSFSEQCINTVIVTVRNFRNEDPHVDSAAIASVHDWVEANKPEDCDVRFIFYEPFDDSVFHPRTPTEATSYFQEQLTSNRDLYTQILEDANAEIENDFYYFPMAQILARVALGEVPGIPALDWETLFADSSPHGEATTYYIGAVATYIVLTGRMPPLDYEVPDLVDSVVIENREALAYFIYDHLNNRCGN